MYSEFSFDFNNLNLYCRKYGSGAPVIMIHGACSDCDYFNFSAELLSGNFCVYTYDRRGYGRSSNASEYNIAVQAKELAALAKSLGGKVYLVGHSAGAVIAMEFIQLCPNMVKKALLYEPPVSCTPDLSPDFSIIYQKISEKIQNHKYAGALALLMSHIGERDSRSANSIDDLLPNFDRDCRCFIENEFFNVFNYQPDRKSLSKANIAIGISEQSHTLQKEHQYKKLAMEINAETIYFPGGHNAPFELPKEFSYITSGIFSI